MGSHNNTEFLIYKKLYFYHIKSQGFWKINKSLRITDLIKNKLMFNIIFISRVEQYEEERGSNLAMPVKCQKIMRLKIKLQINQTIKEF